MSLPTIYLLKFRIALIVFTYGFTGVRIVQSVVFCVVSTIVCLLVLLFLAIVFHVLRITVMYLCVRGIHFASFYDLDIALWNCLERMVFFLFFIIKHLVRSVSFDL